jgi:hypothetical protein
MPAMGPSQERWGGTAAGGAAAPAVPGVAAGLAGSGCAGAGGGVWRLIPEVAPPPRRLAWASAATKLKLSKAMKRLIRIRFTLDSLGGSWR